MPKKPIPEYPPVEETEDASPSGEKASSFTTFLAALRVGGTACRAVLIDPDLTLREWAEMRAEVRRELRNNSAACIRRARIRIGGDCDYSTEIADTMMPSGKLFVVLIVTRIS